jgi:hypothetical protein
MIKEWEPGMIEEIYVVSNIYRGFDTKETFETKKWMKKEIIWVKVCKIKPSEH